MCMSPPHPQAFTLSTVQVEPSGHYQWQFHACPLPEAWVQELCQRIQSEGGIIQQLNYQTLQPLPPHFSIQWSFHSNHTELPKKDNIQNLKALNQWIQESLPSQLL